MLQEPHVNDLARGLAAARQIGVERLEAGADIVVVGSAVYNDRPVKENLDALHKEIHASGDR